MTWTYSGNPGENDKDAVRFFVGDTTEAQPMWQDEEIAFVLSQQTTTEDAAKSLLQSKIRQLAITPRIRLGGFTLDTSAIISNLKENLSMIGINQTTNSPWAGGISFASKKTQIRNDDRVPGRFRRGLFENKR